VVIDAAVNLKVAVPIISTDEAELLRHALPTALTQEDVEVVVFDNACTDATAATVQSGWLMTRDLGWMDEEGYLFFAGRADELLKVSGLWVAPVEVEECLMRHPAVSLAAVIGFEDEGLIKQWIAPELGTRKVADIRRGDIERYDRIILQRSHDIFVAAPQRQIFATRDAGFRV